MERLLGLAYTDKAMHFFIGAVLSVLGAAVALALKAGPLGIWLGATLVALLAGLAKEALDAWANHKARAAGTAPPHTVDPADVLATTLGGMYVGALVAAGIVVASHA